MSTAEQRTLQRIQLYRADLQSYARDCLTIRDKEGSVRRFPGFNEAQRFAHEALEAQLARTGKVRAIVLKGRQQGLSTYIAVRYYRRSTLFRGVNVYILSHEQTASDNLFKMVDRFQTNNPLAPHTGTANVKELEFDRLDSSYVVATAGQKAGGRGRTITLFHGSEVAFWQSAADHFASSVQTVPDMPGTEIILESTGNGAGGEFYERWIDAVKQRSDYIPIFIPWFWQKEYARPAPPDFELQSEPGETGISEREYASLFQLTHDQMAWRRAKIAELRSVQLFDQEYPASPEMAFTSGDVKKSFILPMQVLRARKRRRITPAGPKILGVDPSGPGKDRFAVAARQGLCVLWVQHRQLPETLEALEWLCALIDDHEPDRVFMDLGNRGHDLLSLLRSRGEPYTTLVRGVNFGATSQHKFARPKIPGPKNRRAEMWDRLREWLDLEEGVNLPDEPELQTDLVAPRIKPLISGDFLLESKEDMRKRGVRSPDLGDAVVLTFAEVERIIQAESRKTRARSRRSEAVREVGSFPPPSSFPGEGGNSWMGF